MTIFRKHPKTGEFFRPHQFQDGLYRVADPALGKQKHHAENQIAITEEQILEYVRRGFLLRMKGEDTGQVNLIRPDEILSGGGGSLRVERRVVPKTSLPSSPARANSGTKPIIPPSVARVSERGLLPVHGRIACGDCFPDGHAVWGESEFERGGWRLANNPMAWGSQEPEILVLGFSKGPNQNASILTSRHEDVAFARGRKALGKILDTLGLMPSGRTMDDLIADPSSPMAFGSLIRCSVAKADGKGGWLQSGGDILASCLADRSFGNVIANCIRRHLAALPSSLKIVVMLGNSARYIEGCRRAIGDIRTGLRPINDVAYGDDQVAFVHTIHFAAQGTLVPDWCDGAYGSQAEKRKLAQAAIQLVHRQ